YRGEPVPGHDAGPGLPASSVSPSGARSLPKPIEDPSAWSRGRSLRSTGSPASLASNLEISESPTMPFLSRHRSCHEPSKLCDEPQASLVPEPAPTGCQEPEEVSWPPSEETASPPPEETASPPRGETSSPPPEETMGTHYPVECTEMLAAPSSLSLPSGNAGPVKDQTPLPLPVEDTASQLPNPSPPPPSALRTSPPCPFPSTSPSTGPVPSHPCPPSPNSPELESEQKFYNFVILHAAADEHIALRVRERLEALGVPDGATFCEDFQVPGRGELRCLQDAINHSAFTILLLTPNLDCRLGLHQVSQSLMSSLTRHGWQDCVIPFLPLESSQAQLSRDTCSLLSSLVWLDEHSRVFARRVVNTFKAQQLRARKAQWKKEQDIRALQQQRQHLEGERQQVASLSAAYSAYLQSCSSWQAQMEALRAAFGSHMPFGAQGPYGGPGPLGAPPPLPSWLGHQPPPPAFSPPPAPPQSPGLQPLIIHHAQMVQLGLNNHMWNQRGTQAPEDETQGAE
uniref:TIR domain containing adaptor molecule 1 n=1 Tax=Canis lupus familiaris TaxID=9615 RepID=A0A8I3P245_CANLF